MAGLLLFVSSCQRDELFEASNQIKFKPKDYNPVFDTLVNLSSFTGSSFGILAPSLIQLKQMNSILKEISPNLELARRIKQSVSAGIVPEFDFSIIARSNENDNFYTIAVPFVRDSSVHFILLFHKKEDQYSFKMYSKNEYMSLVDMNKIYQDDEINHIFKIIGFAITYQTRIEKIFDNKINQWVEKYNDFKLKNLMDSRCGNYSITLTVEWGSLSYGSGGWQGPPTITIHSSIIEIMQTYACPEVFGPTPEISWPLFSDGGWGGGIGSSGPGNGISGVENGQAIKTFLPGLPDDCIKSMNNETRELLANIISLEKEGCNNDQRLKDLELGIMNGCNRNQFAAETASNDPFGFEQALNSWDFEQEIRNTLDGYLGISSNIDVGNPILSINKPLCTGIFKVRSHSSKSNTFVAGISNLQFSFDVGQSVPLVFSVANLHFENSATNCDYSFSTAATNAINSGIATMQAAIDLHLKNKAEGKSTKPLNKEDLLIFIHRAYQDELKHCTPHHGSTVGTVSFKADNSPDCGDADYVTLGPDDCP